MSKSILIVMLLLSGCAKVATSEINLCNQLPSVSRLDTTQTILEVDNFNAKYKAAYCNAKS
jgi:uncharacterized protein YceK